MDTEDWPGLVVRTRSALRFGVVVGVFTDGPHAGRLRVHGAYRFGRGTQEGIRLPLAALHGHRPPCMWAGAGVGPALPRAASVASTRWTTAPAPNTAATISAPSPSPLLPARSWPLPGSSIAR